jgi:hypothetical protein
LWSRKTPPSQPPLQDEDGCDARDLGHPDSRLARKALGRDDTIGQANDEILSQQGENLRRGLARINKGFVFLVTAAFVGRPELTAALVKMVQVVSQVASWQHRHGF